MREHIGGSLTDALKVAKESLSDNNSNVVEFLQHLTANSIFVDKLVANNAFINQLFSHRIKLENLEVNGTTEHGAIYGGERYTADGEINDNSNENTQGFHLSSNGLLQANNANIEGTIKASDFHFHNIQCGTEELIFFYKNHNFNMMPKSETAFYNYKYKIKCFLFASGTYNITYGCTFKIFISSGAFYFLTPLKIDVWKESISNTYRPIRSPIEVGTSYNQYTEPCTEIRGVAPNMNLNVEEEDICIVFELTAMFAVIEHNDVKPNVTIDSNSDFDLSIKKHNTLLTNLTVSTLQQELEFERVDV